ncbi:MAG: UDP-N-acetylmuramoyl-L-alanine--D-glutamate ligase [Anaerolineae bacterium]
MKPQERARGWFAGRAVGIIGLGREGTALARFLLPLGGRVVATDDKPVEQLAPEVRGLIQQGLVLYAGGLHEAVLDTSCCFVSPGVPLDLPLVAEARARDLWLWNEPGLFLALCPAVTVGVTGSSGKSTTSSLIAAIMRAAGRKTYLGGNIGLPLIEMVGDMLPQEVAVLELSSFQLELVQHSPDYALITNITPNHLDRHCSMDMYREAKAKIFTQQHPEDVLVLNADDARCQELANRAQSQVCWFSADGKVVEGAYIHDGEVVVQNAGKSNCVCRVTEIKLLGQHNLANVLAASALCHNAGVDAGAIRMAVTDYSGLPHRLELVSVIDQVAYYNDSIATTPERSIAGMRSLDVPIVLLAGGRDKHLPWDAWLVEVRKRAKVVVVFGESAAMLERILISAGEHVERRDTMLEAANVAKQLAKPGDAILLSPGGTSFDEFRDFEERGDCFREWVLSMGKGV